MEQKNPRSKFPQICEPANLNDGSSSGVVLCIEESIEVLETPRAPSGSQYLSDSHAWSNEALKIFFGSELVKVAMTKIN